MAEGLKADAHKKAEIAAQIEAVEENYQILRSYLLGSEKDSLEAVDALQMFKAGLDRVSARILTLYELKGQRTKITWEQLLQNLETALQTLQGSRSRDAKTAIQTAFNMSEPKAEEVMAYLSKLKASLK